MPLYFSTNIFSRQFKTSPDFFFLTNISLQMYSSDYFYLKLILILYLRKCTTFRAFLKVNPYFMQVCRTFSFVTVKDEQYGRLKLICPFGSIGSQLTLRYNKGDTLPSPQSLGGHRGPSLLLGRNKKGFHHRWEAFFIR